MAPEAVAAGLGAGADRRVLRQAEAAAGAVDLATERAEVAGRDGDAARGQSRSGAEGEPPGGPSQLEGQVERRRGGRGTVGIVGR
jgi:hypothetical protein